MKLVAIVLAAGSARRFGSDKLSAELEGELLVRHAIRTARAAPVERVIVVAGEGLAIGDWPGTPEVLRVNIASEALSDSLKAGISEAGSVDGVFVFLGDMPRVPHAIAGKLAEALGDNWAAVPRYQGRAGHPVLLSSRSFGELQKLTGDAGAGKLLKQRNDVAYIECDDPGILFDVDRPGDLTRA